MKKSRFISALTSIVMTAGLMTSALPLGVSADDSVVDKSTTLALRLGAEKASFTMDEVEAGEANTTVSLYADNFNDDDKMTVIMAGFGVSDDGIKISNIRFPDNMGITTEEKKGDEDYAEAFMRFDVAGDDDTCAFFIQGDTLNPMVAEDLTKPIVQFDVSFDSSMSAGTYEINFDNSTTNKVTDAKEIEIQSGYEFRSDDEIAASDISYGMLISSYSKSARKNAKPVKITLGAEPDTEDTKPTGDNKKYDGNVKVWAEDVVGAPGEDVSVPVYVDTNGGTIAGFEIKVVYDKSAFDIAGLKAGTGIKGSAKVNKETGAYVIAQSGATALTNDPSKPICTLTLTPTGAVEGKKYPITFEGTNGSTEILAMKTKGQDGDEDTYYKVNATNGSVTLEATETEPTGKIYDGKIKIWADKVKAAPGEEVEVGIYADSNGSTVAGLELKPVFDESVLSLVNMKAGTGIKGSAKVNKETGAYVIAQSGDKALENNPEKPIATLTLKVDDDVLPGVYEISFEGTNGSPEITAMKTKGQEDEPDTYFDVVTENGSVTIEEAETEPPTTAEPTTVTSIVTVESVVTTIEHITDVEHVTSVEHVTTVEHVTDVEHVTSVEHLTTVEHITTIEHVTSIITVSETEATTEAPVTTTEAKIEVVVPSAEDVAGNSLYWYHVDNTKFYRDGIIVLNVGGDEPVPVTDESTVEFSKTPAEVFDGSGFDYEVEFKVTYNGQEIEGTLPVMIGYRGDANKSNGKTTKDAVNLYDAITIAKTLLPSGKRFDINTFDGFLANADEDKAVDLYDAIAIAKFLLPSSKGAWSENNLGGRKGVKKYSEMIAD